MKAGRNLYPSVEQLLFRLFQIMKLPITCSRISCYFAVSGLPVSVAFLGFIEIKDFGCRRASLTLDFLLFLLFSFGHWSRTSAVSIILVITWLFIL